MDADVPKMPEKPIAICRTSEEIEKKFQRLYAPGKPGLVVHYGPIAAMNVGTGWEDMGVAVIGGRPVRHGYENKSLDCAFSVNTRARNHNSDSAFLQKLTQTTGLVPRSEWDKIIVFGESGNPRLFTVESVEVVKLGGKNVIVMTGQHTGGNRTREKTVYVSLSGNWKDSYEIGFGGSPDKEKFDAAAANFDKALKTVIWKEE